MQGVSARGVSIRYGALTVLDRLDLEIAPSEFLVLLGPSGCGKSTLLNAIAGLIDVDTGSLHIGSRNVTWLEPKDRGIAMVFQSYALYPRMSVRQNMSYGLRVAGLPQAEIAKRVDAAATMLRMTELLDRKPSELSGGQRQRVAIGRALVREAGVFLFDEPLSNLDAQLRAELRVEIKRLHQRLKATMIYVTHDQIEALTLADRIAVMRDRTIQQLGTPQDIYLRPANRFVASFVGSPAMNFLPGRILEDGTVAGEGWRTQIDLPAGEAGRPVTLGVRPEHILVGGAAQQAAGEAAPHEAVVEMVEPMGADALLWCRLGGAPLSVRIGDSAARVAPGDRIPVAFQPSRLNVFDEASGQRL